MPLQVLTVQTQNLSESEISNQRLDTFQKSSGISVQPFEDALLFIFVIICDFLIAVISIASTLLFKG